MGKIVVRATGKSFKHSNGQVFNETPTLTNNTPAVRSLLNEKPPSLKIVLEAVKDKKDNAEKLKDTKTIVKDKHSKEDSK